MKPVQFPDVNVNFTAPLRWNNELHGVCGELPALRDRNAKTFTSHWQATYDERIAIYNGADIVLTVFGSQPPTTIGVEE